MLQNRGFGLPTPCFEQTWKSPDRGQARKSDLVNSRGPDWRKFSELCLLLFSLGKLDRMLPKSWFSKPIFGHSAGSTKLDRPYCKQFRQTPFFVGGSEGLGSMLACTTTSQPLIGSNSQEYAPKKGFHKWTPNLSVFSPHLPCEMAEANFRRFQRFSPRFLSTFYPFRSIFCHFQSVSVSFSQF